MDLWDSVCNFLCTRVAASNTGAANFLISDVIGLSYKWGLKIRPNRSTVQQALQDLLDEYRSKSQDSNVYNLVSKLRDVKKFEGLADDLKNYLLRESISFVANASQKIQNMEKMIDSQDQQIRSLREQSSMSIGSSIQAPQRSHSTTRGRSRIRNQQLIGEEQFQDDEEDLGTPEEYLDDWQFAIKKMTQRIIDQKRSITKLSKLCLGSLNAVEKLEVKLKGTNFKDNPEREIFGDRLGKLENDFGKISLMMKGTSDRVSRLTEFAASDKTQQRMDRLEDHNETLKEYVADLEDKLEMLSKTGKVISPDSSSTTSTLSKDEVELILDEFWQKNLESFVSKMEHETRLEYMEAKVNSIEPSLYPTREELNNRLSELEPGTNQLKITDSKAKDIIEKSINAKTSQIEQMFEGKFASLKKEIESMKSDYNSTRNKLSSEVDALKSQVVTRQSDAEFKTFSTRLTGCEKNLSELSGCGKQILEIENKIKNMTKNNQDLETQYSSFKSLTSNIETLKRSTNEHKVKIETMEKKVADRKDDIDVVKKMHTEIGKQVETVKTELKQVDILANKINSLEKTTSKSAQDVAKIKSLEKGFETNEKEIVSCKKLTDNQTNEIEKLKTKVADLLSKNWQFKIDDLDKKLDAKIETSLKKSNESFSTLSERIQCQEKLFAQVEKELGKTVQTSTAATKKACDEAMSKLTEDQRLTRKLVAELETNLSEFSNVTNRSVREVKKVIESQNNSLKDMSGNAESFQIDALVQFKKIEELETKLKACSAQVSQTKQDLLQHQQDSGNDILVVRQALDSAMRENEQSKKQFETQVLTQVGLKLNQVESGVEDNLKKLESDIIQSNSTLNQVKEKVDKNFQESDLRFTSIVNDHLIEQKKFELKISTVEMKQDELENNLSRLEADRRQLEQDLLTLATKEEIDITRRQVEESVRAKASSITEKLGLVSLSVAELKDHVSRTLESTGNQMDHFKLDFIAEHDQKWKQIFERQQQTFQIVQESCDEIQNLNKMIVDNGSSNLQTREELSTLQEILGDSKAKMDHLQSQMDKVQCGDLNVIQEKIGNLQQEMKEKISDLRLDWDNDRKNFMDGIGKVSKEVSERYSDLVNIYNRGNQELSALTSDMNLRLKNLTKITDNSLSELENKITESFESKLHDAQVDIDERIVANVEMFKTELESKSNQIEELKHMVKVDSNASLDELKGLISKIDSNCELRNDEIQQMVSQQQLQSREHLQRLEDDLCQRIDESCSQLNKKSLEHLVSFRSEVNVSIKTMQQALKEIDMFAQKVNAESMSNNESSRNFTTACLEEVDRKISTHEDEIGQLREFLQTHSENSKAEFESLDSKLSSEIQTIGIRFQNVAEIQSLEKQEDELKRISAEFHSKLDELILSKDFITNDLFKLREESKSANEEALNYLEVKIDDHLKELQLKQENLKNETRKIWEFVKELEETNVKKSFIESLQADLEKLQDNFSTVGSRLADIKLSHVDFQTQQENNQTIWEEKLSDKTAQLENLTKIVESQQFNQGKVSIETLNEFQNRFSSLESSLSLIESNLTDKHKVLEEKIDSFENNVQRVESKCDDEKNKIYGEINFNVKSLNENLRHRFEDFSKKFDDLERYCNVIEGISTALDHLKVDLGKLSNAVRRIDSLELQMGVVDELKSDIERVSSKAEEADSSFKRFTADLQTLTEHMSKSSSTLGHLNAKIDSKDKDVSSISQKMEDMRKEFEVVFEKVDCSENNLLSDFYNMNEKLIQMENDAKRNQKSMLQKFEQMNESLKLTDELGQCYKEKESRKNSEFESKLSDLKSFCSSLQASLEEIHSWRKKLDAVKFVETFHNLETNFVWVVENLKLNQATILDLKNCLKDLEAVKQKIESLEL